MLSSNQVENEVSSFGITSQHIKSCPSIDKHTVASIALAIASLVLVNPLMAQTVPTLSCTSLTSELNTGVSDGNVLALNTPDPLWSQFQEYTTTPQTPPSNSVGWTQAKTTGTVDGSWASFSDAQWLSPGYTSVRAPYPQNQSWPGDWWPRPNPSTVPFYNNYRAQFNLSPEVPASAVSLDLAYMGDDSVIAAYVNGTAVNGFVANGFGAGIYTTLNSGWVTGTTNTLVFTTRDTGWAAGLLVRAHTAGKSICTVSPVSIYKTADKPSYQPGDSVSYQVTVTSKGLIDVFGVTLADSVPAGVADPVWSCSPGAGSAVCPSPADPGASFDLPAQSSLVFTLAGRVTGRGSLDNTATVTPGAGGLCAADTGCSASVTPAYTASTTSPISITKTSNQTNYVSGDVAQYDITLTNEWTANATGLTLADPTPAGISNPVWSCATASGSAVCPNPATPGTLFDLPGGSSLVFTLKGTVTGKASLENTATFTPGTGGECSTSTGCSATVSPTYTPVVTPLVPAPVPTLSEWGLIALSSLLAMFGLARSRRRQS